MSSQQSSTHLGIQLLILYFFSGLTSLAYEVLWVRMLSLQFGVSIFGVIITVTAFMAGLGAGSLLARRYLCRLTNPVKLFAILEGAVAMMALLMPVLLLQIDDIIGRTGTSLIVWYMAEFILIGFLLFIPATLMGAGFPVILRAIKTTPINISHVYGINTIGAAFGALLPLVLLPHYGWLSSMRIVAGIGLAIFLLAFILSRHCVAEISSDNHNQPQLNINLQTLLLYAGIGAAALILEVGWTRIFGMLLLRTEYVLAIILAVFLAGVGLGSVLAEYLKQKYWFSVLPIISCLFVVVSMWLVPSLSQWVHEHNWPDLVTNILWQGGILALLTFPVTLSLGVWFPLLVKRFGGDEHAGSLLYGVNAIGSAAGAMLAGFVFTPWLGTSGSVLLAGLLLLVLGLVWAHSKSLWLLVPVMFAIGFPVMSMPKVERLLPNLYQNTSDIFYHEDALSITHVVEREDGQRLLLADLQRMDAASDPTSVESQKNQSRLPLLLHPAPQQVLYLGLGTGISASAALDFPDLKIDAVELSKGAILAAGHWFTPVNNNILQHTTLYRDDARHYLMTSPKRYDVIIGDLFHPDLVGRGALLSLQQFQRAHQHLSSNGIFVQWLALNQFDVESLKIVLRSFAQVFPDARLFIDGFRLAMVGGVAFTGAPAVAHNLARMDTDAQTGATGDEGPWTWLGRYWGKVHLTDGTVQQEWSPVIEFRLPQARASGDLDLVKVLDYLLHMRPRVEQAASELAVSQSDYAAFERGYIATELAHRSWLALLMNQAAEGQRLLQLAYQANPKDRWIGFAVADGALASYEANPATVDERKMLTSILRIRPDHAEVIKRLWLLEQDAGNTKKAEEYRARLTQISPLDASVRERASVN